LKFKPGDFYSGIIALLLSIVVFGFFGFCYSILDADTRANFVAEMMLAAMLITIFLHSIIYFVFLKHDFSKKKKAIVLTIIAVFTIYIYFKFYFMYHYPKDLFLN
jgi:hypothetical protein